MGECFTQRETEKQYLAVVRGYSEESELIDYALKEQLDKIADAQADQDKAAQSAVTAYQRLATVELPFAVGRYSSARYSLLRLTPQTGRKHQLRRHMKHIFHPIVGDTTHGDGKHNTLFREQFDCHRLLLHAESLTIAHPYSGERVALKAGLDPVFSEIMQQCGWQGLL